MSISRWEPYKDFMTLRQAMDRLFEESVVHPTRLWQGGQSGNVVPLDIYTTENAVVVQASIPGVDPEDVEITMEASTVTIRGEIKPPPEEGDFLIQERRYGPFLRSIELGIPVQAEKADASFKNGVLTLTLPKAESLKPKVIKVKTG